jgi:2-polyprenyl-3-methyl-5-hydroxy-6-metoxy-1,4-benzoquinol methylase
MTVLAGQSENAEQSHRPDAVFNMNLGQWGFRPSVVAWSAPRRRRLFVAREAIVIEGNAPDSPTLADQVSKLFDLVAGYHVTHLVEIARELGVWDALTQNPGRISSELAETLGTDAFYTDVLCRTAFSFGLLNRDGDGWRMAPHFDQILGNPESSFYLARAPRAHMVVGEDYRQYVQHFRAGTTTSYQDHDEKFMREVAEATKTLPRIFLDAVLPRLPELGGRLKAGARVLDVGCGGGWAVVQIAERFPSSRCVGIDVEPYSVQLAQQLIVERNLTDQCEAREQSVDQVTEEGSYDVVTSFLVIHEIPPARKSAAFLAIARALKPGGYFLIFDEAFPETDDALQTMPARFSALAQWYEVTWGNVVNSRSELLALCADAGLRIMEETAFSRFSILVAAKEEKSSRRS